jgi:hypothetical protein
VTLTPTLQRPLLYAMLAATLGAALTWYGPPGPDLAAHLYQRAFFLREGFSFWNNYWYAGRYSFVTYSIFYYPLAAIAGIKLLATLSVAVSACAFGVIAEREWGGLARRTSWVFAVALAASVLSAAFPYMLGMAFALVALAVLQARHFASFGVLVLATFLASPLAFLLLVVVLAAVWLRSRRVLSRGVLPVVATALVGAVLWRLFPGGGRFPFAPTQLVAVLAFCAGGLAFTWRVERARLLFNFFAIYAAACLVCYLVPSEVGANIVRLRFVAAPIAALALSLRRWKPLLPAAAALALALAWNITPLAFSYARGRSDPSSVRAYWAPAIRFLHQHLGPSYRVEAVDTTGHWEADYLPAAGIPLVRGWFRQDDFPQNALLYSPLQRQAFLRWLHQMAARYVVLTDAPVDYSSQSEARLLRSGSSGLAVVFRSAHLTIFAVPSPQPIVTGPGAPRVLSLGTSNIVIKVRRPGTYHVALRFTPYWSAPGACVAETADGMIDLQTATSGIIRLGFAVTPSNALGALTGRRSSCDPAQPKPTGHATAPAGA